MRRTITSGGRGPGYLIESGPNPTLTGAWSHDFLEWSWNIFFFEPHFYRWSFAQKLVSSFTSFSNMLEMNSASRHCTPPWGSKRASGLTPMVQGGGDWQTWPAGVTVGFLLPVCKQHACSFLEPAYTPGTTMRRASRFIRSSEEVRSPGLQCSCASSKS